MNRNVVETVVGAVVLVVAAVFLFFAYTTTQVHAVGGYTLTAQFDKVDGLRDGGDVRISGIKVGTILSQTLDPKTFFANLTSASTRRSSCRWIRSPPSPPRGCWGINSFRSNPATRTQIIPPAGRITHTQSGMSLKSLIGQMIYGQAQQKKDDSSPPAPGRKSLTPAPGAGIAGQRWDPERYRRNASFVPTRAARAGVARRQAGRAHPRSRLRRRRVDRPLAAHPMS